MCLGAMRRAACDMMASARRAGARVLAAGPDVTDAPGPYLNAGADLALVGEGLSALFEVLPRLDARPHADNADLVRGVRGVASLSGGDVRIESGSRPVASAANAGMAACDLAATDPYPPMCLKAHGPFSLNIAAPRACPL